MSMSQVRSIHALVALLMVLLGLGLASTGCRSVGVDPPSGSEALQDATDAYRAYERGDCESTLEMTRPERLETWEPNEIRHSCLLLHAFCQEREGGIGTAREIYEELVATAPSSFAGQDAKERLRVIRIDESDPDHARWMREARDRAISAESARMPIERRAASFPPVAGAAGVEGYALVEFGVTPTGQTSDPVIVESNPPLIFDGTSLRAIRQWQYAPKPGSRKAERMAIKLVFRRQDPALRPDVVEPEPSTAPSTP